MPPLGSGPTPPSWAAGGHQSRPTAPLPARSSSGNVDVPAAVVVMFGITMIRFGCTPSRLMRRQRIARETVMIRFAR